MEHERNTQELSTELRRYIEALVEEAVLLGKAIDVSGCYQQQVFEEEGVNLDILTADLDNLVDCLKDYLRQRTKSSLSLALLLARKCHLSGEEIDTLLSALIETGDRIDEDPQVCDNDDYEFVDLGLSVKWASHNVGASRPEEYGHLYTLEEANGIVEHRLWRMPSDDQIAEIIRNCTILWTSVHGINGVTVTGPNGNSIFFPAAGECTDSGIEDRGEYGCYWCSSDGQIAGTLKHAFGFDEQFNLYRCTGHQTYGLSVRLVI